MASAMIRDFWGGGIDAHASYMQPLIDSGYPPIVFTCPHGVTWYCEPTTEQIAEWAQEGVA